MAGSYLHVVYTSCIEEVEIDGDEVNKPIAVDGHKVGDIRTNEDMLIDNLGDAYEAIEELYGMIWALAIAQCSIDSRGLQPKDLVEWARKNYKSGLETAVDRDLGFKE